jgi:hypothetical protein
MELHDVAGTYADALDLATKPVEVEEIAHRMVDELRRLSALVVEQQEEIDGLVIERDAVGDRADAALDVAADLLARIFDRLGVRPEDPEPTEGSEHEHEWADGKCVCGASVFLGGGQAEDVGPATVHHDDAPAEYDDHRPTLPACDNPACPIPVHPHVHK